MKMKVKFLKPKGLYELHTAEGVYLQYYKNIIAFKGEKIVELGENFDSSRNSMKYLKQFLGFGIVDIRKNIMSGKWKLNLKLGEELWNTMK